jgi:uncharacterized protein YecE (DUF72 family)
MHIRVGTSGWSYKEWKGVFYPADLPPDEMLRYYAARLPTVEINNSFYRIPKEKVLLDWAADAPPDFRFVLKASRRITHISRLADEDDSLGYFLRTVNVLGDRLGPTLFQCPPSLRLDLARLTAFLARVPRTWRAALEFRHASWFTEPVYEALRAHDVALVAVDEDEGEGPGAPLVPTASWGYLRLRRTEYDDAALAAWLDRIRAQPWTEAYAFLKHDEDKPTGPDAAVRLHEMVARPAPTG